MQTVRPMNERPNRRSRKSQPPLGDLAVKGAVRQRGTEFEKQPVRQSVAGMLWAHDCCWFKSSRADFEGQKATTF